jgi:hypothetical protein
MRRWTRRQTAGERGVVVDVEFEEVEEGVCYEGNGAVEFVFYAVADFERLAGLVAGWEGNVLEFVGGVLDVFARFTEGVLVFILLLFVEAPLVFSAPHLPTAT